MKCEECRVAWDELYDGEAPAGTQSRVKVHLDDCPTCRTGYEKFRTAVDALRHTSGILASPAFEAEATGRLTSHLERLELFPPRDEAPTATAPTALAAGARRLAWALAAAVLLGVSVAVLLPMQLRTRSLLSRVESDLDGVRDQLAAATAERPLVAEGQVRVGSQSVPLDDYLRGRGLVPAPGGQGFVPRDWAEAISGGGKVLYRGEWKDVAAFVAEQGATPGPEAARLWLDAHGYEQLGALWVPAGIAETLRSGGVATADGSGTTIEDYLAKLGLVRLEGRWVDRTLLAQIEDRRRIVIDVERAQNRELAEALSGLEIGSPLRWGTLTFYPLLGDSHDENKLVPLHRRLGTGEIGVQERGPGTIIVHNRSADDVALEAGEILVGGRFDRVVAQDTIVMRGTSTEVPVYDVAPAALREEGAFRRESLHWLAPDDLRRRLVAGLGQADVWARTALYRELAPGAESLMDVYRDRGIAEEIERALDALVILKVREDRMVGLAVGVNEKLLGAELFGHRDLMATNFERIIAAAVVEAELERRRPGLRSVMTNDLGGVKRLLENVALAELGGGPVVRSFRMSGGGGGSMVLYQGRVARLTVYEWGRAVRDDDRRQAAEAFPAKVALFVEALRRELSPERPVADRVRAVGDLAGLSHPSAEAAILDSLDDPAREVKLAALAAFPDGVAEAAIPLVKVIRDGAAGDEDLRQRAREVLARTPDPDAWKIAFTDMPEDAGRVAAVEREFDEAVHALPRAEAIPGLIRLYGDPELGLNGEVFRARLEELTGRRFRSALDAHQWWEGEGRLQDWDEP